MNYVQRLPTGPFRKLASRTPSRHKFEHTLLAAGNRIGQSECLHDVSEYQICPLTYSSFAMLTKGIHKVVMRLSKTLCLFMLAATASWLAQAAASQVVEPRRIQKPDDLRHGEGALLLSIRHQTPLSQTMHVRFVLVDDDTRELKFERKVGSGGRSQMLERQVYMYAVPAGRWRLASHLAGCDESITPGQACFLTIGGNRFLLPSATYPSDWLVLEIVNGGITDGNELNLEFPEGTALGVPTSEPAEARTRSLRFKMRVLPASEKPFLQSFSSMRRGKVTFSPQAASASTCERSAKSLRLYYNPFTC